MKFKISTVYFFIFMITLYITTSASYASIDPWSQFSYGIGFYNEDYALDTEATDYNHIYLTVNDLISVAGKNTGYSPFLIPAEYYMYGETGEGKFEKVFLMPILEGGSFTLMSEDVFPEDETGRQPWGTEKVAHYYFIDQENFRIGYKTSVQPYIGETTVSELQELPWPHYLDSNRRVILYPVTEAVGIALGKQYNNDSYQAPNFYADTDMYEEEYYALLPHSSVIETADEWARPELQTAISDGIASDRMTKLHYKMSTTRDEFSELIMTLYDQLEGPEIKITENPFTDTESEYVIRANQAGIVKGIDEGLFDPNGKITREALCVMIVRAIKNAGIKVDEPTSFKQYFDDVSDISSWAKESMMVLNQAGIYKGDGKSFLPKQTVDKQTAVILLYRAYNYYKE